MLWQQAVLLQATSDEAFMNMLDFVQGASHVLSAITTALLLIAFCASPRWWRHPFSALLPLGLGCLIFAVGHWKCNEAFENGSGVGSSAHLFWYTVTNVGTCSMTSSFIVLLGLRGWGHRTDTAMCE